MLTPLLGWAFTGAIFLTKPGYEGAYEKLPIKTYIIEHNPMVTIDSVWTEFRVIRSILGDHLLVKINGVMQQIDPVSLQPAPPPSDKQVRTLINDAITINPDRYGNLSSLQGLTAKTDTGIEIKLDWNRMTLHQRGWDRQLIETLYKIHYLQWTQWEMINKGFAIAGLLLLLALSIIGLIAYLSTRAELRRSE